MARPSKRRRSGFFSDFAAATRDVKKLRRPIHRVDRSRTGRSWFRPHAYGALESGRDDGDPTHKILELTAEDIDPETTALEKNLLKQNQIDARLAGALSRDARRQLSGASLKEAQLALAEGHLTPALEPLFKQLTADFGTGKAAVFTIWVGEDESQRGNAVDLQLDGIPLGRFSIEQNRYAITLVERTGKSLRLEITGVTGANRGAVFRAETATREAETRHLRPGKNDFWQLVVK